MRELIAGDRAETLTYRWLETGAGIPVILIHGIPTSPELWRRVVPLVPGAGLLAWEMVGYGRSRSHGLGADISVKAQANHLGRWLDEVGIDKPVLVGHDLGGGVAQIAGTRQPERVAGIVLCNSIAYDSWPIPSVKAMRALGGRLERMPPGMLRRLFSFVISQGHDDADRADESITAHWPGYAHSDGPAAFVRQDPVAPYRGHARDRRSSVRAQRPGGSRVGSRRPVPEGEVRSQARARPSSRADGGRRRQALCPGGPPQAVGGRHPVRHRPRPGVEGSGSESARSVKRLA
jgi:pimeloyl-ACP methyl ester carboxylesterase